MSTTCEKKIDKAGGSIEAFKEFTYKAYNITKKCVKIFFNFCNITKKHSIIFCKSINEEIIKDLLKNE